MAPNEDPGYARLLLLVGGIDANVKNILIRQDRQDDKIESVEKRIVSLEAFKWKAIGALSVISAGITAVLLMVKELVYG